MIKALKITVLVLICLALVGFMISFIHSGFNFSNMKAELVKEEEIELADIKNISVIAKSSDINIYDTDGEKVIVKFYSDKKSNIDITTEEKELKIDSRQKGSICFGFCFGNRRIDVYVPKTYDGKFTIKTTSGDIKSELDKNNDYEIKVTSGDIKIDKLKSLVGSATSGDLEIEEISESIDFRPTSGDIDIDIFDVNKNSSIKVTSGDVEINKLTNAYVATSVKSGDVKINGNDRHAKYELVIKTTSGDIEVN